MRGGHFTFKGKDWGWRDVWPTWDLEDRLVGGMLRGKKGVATVSQIVQNPDGVRKDFELHPEGS